MNFDRGVKLKHNFLVKFLASFLVLFLSLLVLSSFVCASELRVNISMDRSTYNIGDRVTVYLNFNQNVSYTLVERGPSGRKTIVRNKHVSAGRHTIQGTIEGPTGRKTLEVIAQGQYGQKATSSFTYEVVGRDSGQPEKPDEPQQEFSLSYFMQNQPSEGRSRDLSVKLQRGSRVVQPGDSDYRQLKRKFSAKGRSIDLSREERNLKAFGAPGTEGKALVKRDQNYSSLRMEVNNRGISYFGRTGQRRLFLMRNPRALAILPCGCWTCCQPYFICLPSWMPWPLPPQWIFWIWYSVL